MSTNNTILALKRDTEEYREKLPKLNLPNAELIIPEHEDEVTDEMLDRVNIILGNPPITKDFVNRAKKMVWMQSSFAGIDALVNDELKQDYILTNVKDTYGDGMAEYVIGYILLIEKEILENFENQRNKEWKERCFDTIHNKTI